MRRPLLLALVASGCAAPLEPTFTEDLTVIGGCGDVVLFARNEADTLLLKATRATGLVEQVERTGAPAQAVADFPSDDIALVVQVGRQLTDATCDDVVEDGGPQVDATWVPTEGSATILVDPPRLDEALPRADLVLLDLVLAPERGRGEPVEVDELRIEDVLVGWYAG